MPIVALPVLIVLNLLVLIVWRGETEGKESFVYAI